MKTHSSHVSQESDREGSDAAIRRHRALVMCAFTFCRHTRPADPATSPQVPPAPAEVSGGERGLTVTVPPVPLCRPRAVRYVRGWLTPCALLQRWWRNWSSRPPLAELQALVTAVTAG
ncbi:hypothetical protein GCM10023075_83430 [Streptosporangium album]